MVKEEIGPGVGALALISVLAIMIILIAVLALVVVQALANSPWGVFTIAMTIPVALIMGFGLRGGKVSVMAVTVFGLLGLGFGVWGGQFLGAFSGDRSAGFGTTRNGWRGRSWFTAWRRRSCRFGCC